ncbi:MULTISPECIES: class I SAM-dependent methyltransferase [Gordonia]|uniref:Methyltransferase type 11 domain-containing protein n=2 Tax=Gordonia alkanivorans TaxID=84096 RepID=F9VQN3_9ACTN|nr:MULTISPECIES: class I SAM-dependent methyltransferase [Gordonia]ETA08462.1 SAM-dependent methyltransferase [Gordonia alkanivorans CGMCC 6845]MDH3008186.1 class I SAM-dependent methyltransferase [Gordonia alkanivorans]MDH3017128.1 class I SAM-dependent methyltransferase [Gordonia alkanivorans]MDH3042373.1 class I SAM-dependent methyltransferase [Gordonia alkanivorans]MDH3050193.1 class I SAM-dependent methyltransferase [Gordonia alkanivorans]
MTTTTSGRDRMARLATLRRAAGLLNDFRYEQSDPARFYGALAADTAEMVQAFVPDLDGGVILDVGGGPGYFADAFRARGAHYMSVEPDPTEMHAGGLEHRGSVRGSGQNLPFADDCIDVTVSSNVVEHTLTPWEMADDMLRVTRPGGVVIISYTLWWGPFGGHEMGLTHYLGGHRAARLYTRRHGHPPKNLFGTSLFAVHAADGLRWAGSVTDRAELLAAFPRYIPRWMWWVMRVPGLREVLGTNLVLVLRKR